MKSHNKRLAHAVVSASVIGALSFGGMSAGNAATLTAPTVATSYSAPSVTILAAGSVASTSSAASSGAVTSSGGLSTLPQAQGGQASTQAVPIGVRLAVKAAMAVLKRTSTTWYNAIRAALNRGRTAFVNWWNNSVPSNIKDIIYTVTGGLSGNALYDALLWVFGLN